MNFKKVLALVLVVAMCLSMVPTYAFADDVELWDEGDYAVQNDAPLEDEYIDEDPVVYDPVPEEPAATDIEEPAAEEPVAEEPAAEEIPAAQTNETAALTAGETLEFNADDPTATIGPNKYDTLQEAINAAAANDYIQLRKSTTEEIRINKTLTIEALNNAEINGGISMTAGTVTLVNVKVTSILVEGGVLTIDEDDEGTYGTVQAISSVNSGAVKGGTFTKIPVVLLADDYYAVDGASSLSKLVVDPSVTLTGNLKVVKLADLSFMAKIELADGKTNYYKDFAAAALEVRRGNVAKDSIIIPLNDIEWAPGTSNAGSWAGKPFRVANDTDNTVKITYTNDAGQHYMMTETPALGSNYTVYELVEATASYEGATGRVYTTSFKAAAEGAASLENPLVTLYKLPKEGDTYEMESGTLTVATSTDITSGWNRDAAKKLVTAPEKAIKVDFNNNNVATYTVSDAEAMIELADGTKVCFITFAEAALAIRRGRIDDTAVDTSSLVITPLKDIVWSPGTSNARYWVDKPFRVANNTGKSVSITYKSTAKQHYMMTETPALGSNYTTYMMVEATASYDGAEGRVFTTNFKAAAEGAASLENPLVTLYKLPIEGDTYEMESGTLKVATSTDITSGWNRDAAKKLVIAPEKAIKVDFNNNNVATYTVSDAEAMIELADGTDVYFNSFAEAALAIRRGRIDGAAVDTSSLVITPLTDIEWAPGTSNAGSWVGKPFRVANNTGKNVSITYTNGDDQHFVMTKTPALGGNYTTYELVVATASYEGAAGTVYTASFEDAAKEAVNLTNPEVTLYKLPIEGDTYEMESGTLKVATSTDVTEGWNEEAANKLVTVSGEKVLDVTFNPKENTATYTVSAAEAMIELADGTKVYYLTFAEAALAIRRGQIDGATVDTSSLVITPLTDIEWAPGTSNAGSWVGKPFRVANNTGKNVSITYTNGDDQHFVMTKTPALGGNYTTYELVEATASYFGEDEKPVFTTTFKEAAAKAAELDSKDPKDYAVTLYQLPNVTEGDVYDMGAGKLTVTTATDLASTEWWTEKNAAAIVTVTGEFDYDDVTFTNGVAVYEVTVPVASVTVNGAVKYFDNLPEAIADAFDRQGTLKLLVAAPESYTYTWTDTDYANSLKISGDGYNLPMDVDAPYVLMHEGVGVVTWTAEPAVASYVDAENEIVYTDSFNDAATNAYAVAAEGADVTVTLHQIPAEKDTYALAGDNALVVATGTDMTEGETLATEWTFEAAKKLVTAADANSNVICDWTEANGNPVAVYTLEKAVAMIELNGGEIEYHFDVQEAVDVIIEHPNDPLFIVPLENVSFTFNGEKLNDYLGQPIRIDNSGEKKITMPDVIVGGVRYTYSETPNTVYNYTTYTLKKAVASIPVDPILDEYYDPQHGTKYFASVNEAVAFDPTAVVTLIAANEDGETYTLGIPGGPTTLKVVKGNYEWLTVKADGAAVVNEDPDPTDESITVYTLVEPVVAVTLNAGTEDEETKYYDSIASAVAKNPKLVYTGNVPHLVAELVADDDVEFFLNANEWIDVKGEYSNSIAVPDNTTTAHYVLDDATVVDGVTTYKCVAAEATVGNGYYTLEEAATVAGGTEVITLLNSGKSTTSSYSYSLGAEGKAEKLVINLNGQKINVTSGVEGMAVHETTPIVGGKAVSAYELVEPVASVTVKGKTTYYDTFAHAADAAGEDYTIVLLDNITTAYPLDVGSEIKVQLNTFDVPVNAKAEAGSGKPAMIVKSLDETTGVTTFNSIYAVATIDFGTAEEPEVEYYATVGGEDGAITAAFVAEGTDPVYTVVLTGEALGEEDIFTAESKGSFLADVSAIAEEDLPDYLGHVEAAEGDFVSTKAVEGKEGIVLVSFHGAVAYRNNNQSQPEYFETIEDAVAKGSNQRFPIVLLADELSTTLENGGELYINKNGHDFTVTKAYPDQYWVDGVPVDEVQYSILENKNGDVTVYSTGDAVAFIDYPTTAPSGAHEEEVKHNYVFYDTFAEAVTAAGGVKTIIINVKNAGLGDDAKYTLAVGETLIVNTRWEQLTVAAPEGYERKDDVVTEGENVIHTYTVQEVVAYVVTGEVETPYTDLRLALRDAIDGYQENSQVSALLKLNKAPADDFTFTFNTLDKLYVVQDAEYSFEPKNFIAPEGSFVKIIGATQEGTMNLERWGIASAVASVTTEDEEGKPVVTVYASFAEAVEKVRAIEDAKAYNDPTKDVLNPDTVIDLLADNDAANGYTFFASLKSLMIATNGFDPKLKPSGEGNYVEELETNVAGVSNFRDVKLVAIIDRSPSWMGENDPARAEYTTKFSSFAEAAAKAHNKPELTVTLVAMPDVMPGTTDVRDVFEMGIGTLKVDVKKDVSGIDLNFFINADPKQARVIPDGENVVASFAGTDTAGTFTVEGNEAMIVYPGEPIPRYFKTFELALDEAKNQQNLAITPLTSLKKTLTGLADGDFFNVAASEYDVEFRAEELELVASGTDPVKYTAMTAVARVDTETIDSYDNKYAPVYVKAYFADLGRASKFAANTKAVTLLGNVTTYALGTNGADEVLNLIESNTAKLANIPSAIEGMGSYLDTTAARPDGAQVWKLTAEKSVVVFAEGGQFQDGKNVKTFATGVPGSAVSYDDMPVRTGYTLDYLTGNDQKNYKFTTGAVPEGYEPLPTKMPANGLELHSVWAANDVQVQFIDNGNVITELNTTAKYDGKITQPTYTAATGWHLVGWYTDDTYTEEFDFVNTAVTTAIMTGEVVKIYGKFEKDVFTVHFTTLADNVPDDSVYDATVEYGDKVVGPAVTEWTRAGYKDGKVTAWMYTAPGATEPTAWDWSTGVTSNLTLVADWEPETMTLVWVDRSEVLAVSDDVDVDSELEPPVDVTKLSNTGYRVDPEKAWIDDLGNIYDGTVPYHKTAENNENQWVFKVNWIEQVDVSFIYNDELIKTIQVDKNSKLADNENVPKPDDATKVYTWTLKGEAYDLSTPVTATMTLVGTLADAPAVDEFTVKFESAHGVVPEARKVKAGETVVKPADPTEEGWTFNGWFAPEAETAFDFTTPITADLTLTAKWTKNEQPAGDESGVTLKGASLELEGKIILDFYVDVAEKSDAAAIRLTLNDRVIEKPITEPDGNRYGFDFFAVPVYAKELDDKVWVEILDAEGNVLSFTVGPDVVEIFGYSVKDYFAIAPAAAADLMDALGSFGDYAKYFFENRDGETSLDGVTPTVDMVAIEKYAAKINTTEAYTGAAPAGASLVLESGTTLKVYFTGDATGVEFTVDGTPATLTEESGMTVVLIDDIAAKDLDENFTVVATNSTGSSTITVSALSYVNIVLNGKGYSRTQKDAMIKLYDYNVAANAFFG